MVINCIVCGDECKVIKCSGNIKEMEISFCDEHAEYCENCETIRCGVLVKN